MVQNKLVKKIILGSLMSIVFTFAAQAQTKYWVKFKNKTGSPYSISTPSAFLSAKSIARRVNQSIAIDMTDIPVNQSYVNLVNATGALVFQRSKWFNAAIVIISNPSQLTAINTWKYEIN